jgi:hypothetical protein
MKTEKISKERSVCPFCESRDIVYRNGEGDKIYFNDKRYINSVSIGMSCVACSRDFTSSFEIGDFIENYGVLNEVAL